jgi:hypothetical protein
VVARGVDVNSADSFVHKCQLPELVIGSGASPKILWPPKETNHALEYALSVGRMLSGPMMPPTAAEKAVEAKRVEDFYWEQERGRELRNSEAVRKAAGGAG